MKYGMKSLRAQPPDAVSAARFLSDAGRRGWRARCTAGVAPWPRGLAAVFAGLAILSLPAAAARAQQPEPISATLLQPPAEHDGVAAFGVGLDFSREPSGLSYRSIDGGIVDVEGGSITRVWRLGRGSSRRWILRVSPGSTGDVTITVRATADCAAQHAVCAADGGMLATGTQVTVPGPPPALSVADATATEREGATLDFTVTLIRAPAETVTVSYATSDGTATAGSDYTSTSGTLTFRANETSQTVSVPVLDDSLGESSETLTLTLSDPSPSHVRLADASATGTIAGGTAPAGPTGLTATAGDSEVALSWAQPGDPSIERYQLRWRAGGGATWDRDWTDIANSDGATTSHVVAGLANGSQHIFQLRAVNEQGAGAASAAVTATPAAAPSAPTGLTATAGDGEAALSWAQPGDPSIERYQLRWRAGGGATWDRDWTDIANSDGATTSHVVAGLANGSQHIFQLRAVNERGFGAASAAVTATPAAAPSAPTGLTATAGDGEAVLAWTAGPDNGSAVTKWQLRRSADGGTAWAPGWTNIAGSGATTASHTVTGLANGTAYSFQLRAVNERGVGAASAAATATPAAAPSAPTGLTATAGDGEAALAWTAGPDNGSAVTRWQLRRSTDGGATWGPGWTNIAGSGATTASHTVTGLANGTAYSFQLRAVNERGVGAVSAAATATLAAAPSAPTGLTATAGDGEAVLAWTAGPDNGSAVTRWQLRRSTDGGATWAPGWTNIAGSGATTASHTVTGLANGTAYSFQLRAVNERGVGAASTAATATPAAAPSAPTGLTATAGDGEAVLAWTAGPDNDSAVTGWQLRRSTDGGATWAPGWTNIAGSGATTASHTVTGLANGTAYSFQLRAVNERGVGAASGLVAATPRSDPADPQPVVPTAPRTVSGVLPGSLAVNPYGAATYEIPIAVPPGTAGVEPSLSLVYASNGGNGLLGLGWSLGGLSAIGRCPKTPAQDGARGAIGYDADDRFCLDGRRLVAVSGAYGADGTEYRTEIDGFGKIVSRGSAGTGPAWFEVRTKSGQTMRYGSTADSRIEAVGRIEVRLWSIDRVTDAVGNYLTVRYREEDGQGYPDRIDYTGYGTDGAPYASVRFAYQTRHDVRVLASGGSTHRMDERLTRVRTYHGTTMVSEYRLTYSSAGLPQPSRVARVKRCDRGGTCLPATNFVWSDVGDGTLTAAAQGGTVVSGDFSDYDPLQGDFDGDGVTDLAWAHARNGGLRVRVALGDGDGGFAAPQQSDPKTSGNFSKYEPLVGDFDGDGLSDIAWTRANSAGLHAWVALGDGDGTLGTARYFRTFNGASSNYKPLVGDFDGDGVSDIAWTKADRYGLYARVALGEGDGSLAAARQSNPEQWQSEGLALFFSSLFASTLRPLAGDFNGDGLSDVVWASGPSDGMRVLGLHAYVSLGRGDGTLGAAKYSRPRSGGSPDYRPLVGDFNGDGVADLVWTRIERSSTSAFTALGKGDGTLSAATYSVPRLHGCWFACAAIPSTGDFNGDGVTDLAWLGTKIRRRDPCWTCNYSYDHNWARAEIALSEGDGSFATARVFEWYSERRWKYYVPLAGDFDGDGVSDVAWTKASSSGIYAYTGLAEARSSYGRVSWIWSSTGPSFSLSHAPLTDASVYVKDTGEDACALPCLDVQAPLHVVRRVHKFYRGGLSHSTTYRYGGAKADVSGRGFLGFRWMEATDGSTGVLTSTEYRQDYPYIGRVSTSSSFLADGTALSAEENSWARLSLNGGKTVFPYVSRSVAETYELTDGPDNEPVATVTTASTYDDYGNPTAMTVTTAGAGGSFVKRTANAYTNDVANWHLGRLTCARVTSEAPGQTTRTRVSGFAYDAATGLLTKEVVEPGAGDVPGCVSAAAASGITLVTAHNHDRHGNRTRATVSGPGIAARTSATAWGERSADGTVTANGRFAIRATNALGHFETRRHDPAHGGVVRLRGPNGLETAWGYDGFGRALRETRADGTETATERLSCPTAGVTCPSGAVRAVRVRASGSAATLRYLDGRGLEVRVETEGLDGRKIHRDTEYDALGRAVRSSRPYYAGGTARWTAAAYDVAGRMVRETRPDGSRTEIAHDGLVGGSVRQRVKVFPAGAGQADSAARITTRLSDALGRLVKVTDPLGNATTYVRDALGNLVKTTDASGNVTTLAYDLRGRKTSMDDPDMGRWSYRHDALGKLVSQTDAKGQTARMSYDVLGRLVRRVEPGGTTSWSHDRAAGGIGKLHRVRGPEGYVRTHSYDRLGRPESETFSIAGETFRTGRSYDGLGRVATLAYPKTGVAVGRSYTSRGHLRAVYDAENPATVYWRADAADAEGRVVEAMLGNGISTTRTYDPATGLVRSIQSGPGETATVQDLGYAFDSLGNLTSREDFLQDVYESFAYDRLNRLTGATVYDADDDTARAARTYRYDAIGNIVNKSDVGAADYVYGSGNAAGAGDAGPHAVVSAGGRSYAYDDNGNMVSGAGRALTWTSFNKPATIANAAATTAFSYGPGRERVVQTRARGAAVTETVYVAGLFERVRETGRATEFVHYVFAGSQRVAIRTVDDAPTPADRLRYLHHDHLGSVDTVTDAAGAVVERLSYDAFGKRRIATGENAWTDPALAITAVNTPRGFTGHEHLDDFVLVHMNGRIQDPHLGRFLSADPFVQFPESTQGLNRYAYALNNPLSFTDPSGYFLKFIGRVFRAVGRFVGKVLNSGIGRTILQLVATAAICTAEPTVSCAAWVSAGIGGASAVAAGGDLGDVFKAAAVSFASAYAFGEVGQHFKLGANAAVGDYLAKAVAHGTVGGVTAVASGGEFKDGFLGAGAASLASPAIGRIPGKGLAARGARIAAAAVVGGTASKLGGGKFANGARTAAFLQAFAEASDHYREYTRRNAKPGPGKFALPGDTNPKRYVYRPTKSGHIPQGHDLTVIGTQDDLTGDLARDFFTQGGSFGSAATFVPGVEATAVYHDTVVYQAEISMGETYNRWIVNFATIPHSAAISYGAVVGKYTRGWANSAAYYMYAAGSHN